jgi:hypothetical protein
MIGRGARQGQDAETVRQRYGKVKAEAKAEMKNVRSSLNLDLDLILLHSLRPCMGLGASQGEESVLADSGRESEITAGVGRVRSLVCLSILRDGLKRNVGLRVRHARLARRAMVRGPKFEVFGTPNFELLIAPFSPFTRYGPFTLRLGRCPFRSGGIREPLYHG